MQSNQFSTGRGLACIAQSSLSRDPEASRLCASRTRITLKRQLSMRIGPNQARLLALFFTIVAGLQTGCNHQEPNASAPAPTAAPKHSYKFVVVSHATAVPFFVPV